MNDNRGPTPGRWTPTRTAIIGNAALILVATALIASVAYRTRLITTNIDGLSMMSIARQYADGNVADAVNGYARP